MKPTEKEIDKVVAFLLGWTEDAQCYVSPEGARYRKGEVIAFAILDPWPQYTRNRNALPHMTELLSFAQEKEYVKFMAQRFHMSVSGPEHFWPSHVVVDMIEAPMSWHVEAILRALGKWPKEWE